MEPAIIYFLIIASIALGFVGSKRKIGFWKSFFLSLFLTPLIGLVVVLNSKNIEKEEYENKLLQVQQNQQEALSKLSQEKPSNASVGSIAEELEKLTKLKNDNIISEEEFLKLKDKLINV